MLNTLKPNYITVQPIGDNGGIYDKDLNDIVKTLPITSLLDENGYELMDHVFYIDSIEKLSVYESLFEFASMIYYMSEEYFEGIEYNKIFVLFKDSKTDKQLFGLTIWEEDGELEFATVDFSDDEECGCDGDCEHCQYNSEEFEENEDFILPKYFFGFAEYK